MRSFHSSCLSRVGWGGKRKGSKHICISESLVPRELLWAVSANLFSLQPTSNKPPSLCSAALTPGQIFQLSSNWRGWIWGAANLISDHLISKWLCSFWAFVFSQAWTHVPLGMQQRKVVRVSPSFSIYLKESWHSWCNKVSQDRSAPLSLRWRSPGQTSMPALRPHLRD